MSACAHVGVCVCVCTGELCAGTPLENSWKLGKPGSAGALLGWVMLKSEPAVHGYTQVCTSTGKKQGNGKTAKKRS